MEVLRLEVVGRAAAPVHDVLVLALAAQLPVPVGDAQVVVHHGVAVGAVLQHRVEEGLQGRERRDRPEASSSLPPQHHGTAQGLSREAPQSSLQRGSATTWSDSGHMGCLVQSG